MENLLIEKVKINTISQKKRLLCYWFYFQKSLGNSVSEIWDEYEKILDNAENWHENYIEFFDNVSEDDENKMLDEFYAETGNKDKSEQKVLEKTWNSVRDLIKKEIDCEKKLRDILNEKAKDHPIIARIIIAILTGILLGLVEDCIHDAIQMCDTQETAQTTNIYITDVNNNYYQILYENNGIVIKEVQ